MTGPRLGKEAILRAALELFAERGVDAVTLREIHEASGHKNRSAIAYHFGDRDELVKALVELIVVHHDARRVEMLDALEARPEPATLDEVLAAGLGPMIEDLGDREGRLRLRVIANLVADERYMGMTQALMWQLPGLGRSTQFIAAGLGFLPEALREERIVLATGFGVRAFADQARLMDSAAPNRAPLDTTTFAAHLLVLLRVLLEAPAPDLAAPTSGTVDV